MKALRIMLEEIQTYLCVVKAKSFSRAAESLGMSTSAVTRRVLHLEQTLGAQLLHRNTRALSLTEAGKLAYENLATMNRTFQQTQEAITSLSNEVVGSLKVGVPNSIIECHIIPALQAFTKDYPRLAIELVQGNHLLDLIDESFDLVVHCGEPPDSSLYAKRLGYWQQIACASPAYLEQRSTPATIEDLQEHSCLVHSDNVKRSWQFLVDQQPVLHKVNGSLRCNSSRHLKSLALAGLGIAYLPSFLIFNEVKQGQLAPILNDYRYGPLEMNVVYPSREYLSSKSRVFISFLESLPFLSSKI